MSSSKPGDTLRCCFSTTRDLLYVLLPREVSLSLGLYVAPALLQLGSFLVIWRKPDCSQCCSEPGRPVTPSKSGAAQLNAVVEGMLPR